MLAIDRAQHVFLLFSVRKRSYKTVKLGEKKPLKITNFFDYTENQKQNIYSKCPNYADLRNIYIHCDWSITSAVRWVKRNSLTVLRLV